MGALLRSANVLVMFEDSAAFMHSCWKTIIEKRHLRPDKASAWVLGTSLSLLESAGESTRLAMAQNMTRLKETEARLEEARHGLAVQAALVRQKDTLLREADH